MERGLTLNYKTLSSFNFENQPFGALRLACIELVEMLRAGPSERFRKRSQDPGVSRSWVRLDVGRGYSKAAGGLL
jgi:hypothetical protein